MKPDWPKIRAHYEQTGESLRAVAERFAVSISTLFKKAARDKWKQNGGVAAFGVEANGSKALSGFGPRHPTRVTACDV